VKKPLLSVCVITYNHAKYIDEALDSILMQKVNFAWELIIADDYSTDGTREILKKYEKNHSNIKLIFQTKNFGPEKNWLDLMAYPKTQYVLYMEGDDYLLDPNKLQKQVDFLETHNDFALCFHPVKVVYEDGSHEDDIFPKTSLFRGKKHPELKDLLAGNFIQTNSVMYRWRFRSVNVKEIFPKGIIPGDWFMHILHAQNGKIGFINEPMSVYRRHAGGLWWASHNDRNELWQKYALPHMRAYYEVLKLFGDNPEYKKIIYRSINNVFREVLNMQEEDKEKYIHSLFIEFPVAAENFILSYNEAVEEKDRKISELHGVIDERYEEFKKISNEFHATKVALAKAEAELAFIKNTSAWKLMKKAAPARRAAKKLKPRKAS
jgi:glycosyltransferase involved in cell wall biosynthesis